MSKLAVPASSNLPSPIIRAQSPRSSNTLADETHNFYLNSTTDESTRLDSNLSDPAPAIGNFDSDGFLLGDLAASQFSTKTLQDQLFPSNDAKPKH
jgi:hypothetical protein